MITRTDTLRTRSAGDTTAGESWFEHLTARIGRQFIENPLSLWTLALRLVHAYLDVAPRSGASGLWRFLGRIFLQTLRTLGRGLVPVAGVGVVMGAAVGVIVGEFGDLVRPLFDIYAFSIILHQVLPLILTLLIIARNGSAITGKFLTYPFGHGLPQPGGKFSNRLLLDLVLKHCIASVLSSAVLYIILAACVILGYMSSGSLDEITGGLIGSISDFIEVKQIWSDLVSATIKSMLFAGIVSYAAAALGIAGAERITSEVHDATDYYYPVWESAVIALLLCAASAGLLWNVKFSP